MLRNNIMGEPHINEIVGMEVSEAKTHLENHGKLLRVINEDGVSKMVKADINMNRVNVFVVKGIVINLDKLG